MNTRYKSWNPSSSLFTYAFLFGVENPRIQNNLDFLICHQILVKSLCIQLFNIELVHICLNILFLFIGIILDIDSEHASCMHLDFIIRNLADCVHFIYPFVCLYVWGFVCVLIFYLCFSLFGEHIRWCFLY